MNHLLRDGVGVPHTRKEKIENEGFELRRHRQNGQDGPTVEWPNAMKLQVRKLRAVHVQNGFVEWEKATF